MKETNKKSQFYTRFNNGIKAYNEMKNLTIEQKNNLSAMDYDVFQTLISLGDNGLKAYNAIIRERELDVKVSINKITL